MPAIKSQTLHRVDPLALYTYVSTLSSPQTQSQFISSFNFRNSLSKSSTDSRDESFVTSPCRLHCSMQQEAMQARTRAAEAVLLQSTELSTGAVACPCCEG